jgi:hypothetical protein
MTKNRGVLTIVTQTQIFCSKILLASIGNTAWIVLWSHDSRASAIGKTWDRPGRWKKVSTKPSDMKKMCKNHDCGTIPGKFSSNIGTIQYGNHIY